MASITSSETTMKEVVETEEDVKNITTKILEAIDDGSKSTGLLSKKETIENTKNAKVHSDITDKIGEMSVKTKEKINEDMQKFIVRYITQINTFAALSFETFGKGALFLISKCTFTDLCSENATSNDRMFVMIWGTETPQENHNFTSEDLSYFFKEYCTTLPSFVSNMTKESNRFPIVISCSPTGTKIHPMLRNFIRMPKGYGDSVENHKHGMELIADVKKTKFAENGLFCDQCLTNLNKNFFLCELCMDFAYCATCFKLSERPFHEQYGLNEKGKSIEYSSVGQVAFLDYESMLAAGHKMYFDKSVGLPLEIVAINIDRDKTEPNV